MAQRVEAEIGLGTAASVTVAPRMIVHYVENHHYHPPEDFRIVVLSCPEQSQSAGEFNNMLDNNTAVRPREVEGLTCGRSRRSATQRLASCRIAAVLPR